MLFLGEHRSCQQHVEFLLSYLALIMNENMNRNVININMSFVDNIALCYQQQFEFMSLYIFIYIYTIYNSIFVTLHVTESKVTEMFFCASKISIRISSSFASSRSMVIPSFSTSCLTSFG